MVSVEFARKQIGHKTSSCVITIERLGIMTDTQPSRSHKVSIVMTSQS